MAFPLMRGYDRINVVADLDPVAALRDKDLGERMRAYPRFIPAGAPDFGFAIQTDGSWRIRAAGGRDPYGSRLLLATHLREEAQECESDPKVQRAMLAAADRRDPNSTYWDAGSASSASPG